MKRSRLKNLYVRIDEDLMRRFKMYCAYQKMMIKEAIRLMIENELKNMKIEPLKARKDGRRK